MIVLMAGGAALALLMREDRAGSEHLAPAQPPQGGDQGDDAQADATRTPLPVVFASDLEAMLAMVVAAGGVIVKPVFAFPGGRRFHFRDPAGNELAVWSET